MSSDSLLLLILAAFAVLGIFTSCFRRTKYLYPSNERSHRKRQLKGIVLISVVIISVLLTVIFPIGAFNSSLQALITAVVVLVPILTLYGIFSIVVWLRTRMANSDEGRLSYQKEGVGQERYKPLLSRRIARGQSGGSTLLPDQHPNSIDSLSVIDVNAPTDPDSSQEAVRYEFGLERATAQRDETDERTQETAVADPADETISLELEAQLDRISDLVDSHHLDSTLAYLDDSDLPELIDERLMDELTEFAADAKSDLPDAAVALTRPEAMMLEVNKLSGENVNLKKLILAQHARFKAEQRAHATTKTLAEDAVTIMKIARRSQKMAEKEARRLQTEKVRLVQQNERMARVLRNAKSLVDDVEV